MPIDWGNFQGRTTFILGADKHAGKTTFLKYALVNLRALGWRVAYATVGVDSERNDLLTGQLKPIITAEAGDYVLTTTGALGQTSATLKILEVFPEASIMGRPVLVEVLRGGQVELIGPSGNRQLAEILALIHRQLHPDAVLVDGAVDRVTQVAASRDAGFVMVVRVEPSGVTSAVDRVRLIWLLESLGEANSDCLGPGTFTVDGALTRAKAQRIPKDSRTVVIQDFTRVFLSWREMVELSRRHAVRLRDRFELLFFVVILCDLAGEEFLEMLGGDVDRRRIVFNPYMEPAAC